MSWKYRCARCGCYLDSGEGKNYPGEGRICDDCVRQLDLETAFRKAGRPAEEERRGPVGEAV